MAATPRPLSGDEDVPRPTGSVRRRRLLVLVLLGALLGAVVLGHD